MTGRSETTIPTRGIVSGEAGIATPAAICGRRSVSTATGVYHSRRWISTGGLFSAWVRAVRTALGYLYMAFMTPQDDRCTGDMSLPSLSHAMHQPLNCVEMSEPKKKPIFTCWPT